MISPPPVNEQPNSGPWLKWFNSIFSGFRNIETEGDVVIDNTSRGVVLKDSAGHYWRIKISPTGVISGTDLGINKPQGV
jgi:hypothetical protein